MGEPITKELCDAMHKTCTERFDRDKERIVDLEVVTKEMSGAIIKLTTLMESMCKGSADNATQIQQQHDIIIKLDSIIQNHDTKIEGHDKAIIELQKEPKNKWDRFIGWLGAAIVSGIVAFLFSIFGNGGGSNKP